MMAEAKAWIDFACIICAPEYRHSCWMDTKEGVAHSKGCVVDVVFGRSLCLNRDNRKEEGKWDLILDTV